MVYTHIMGYYSSMKKNEILPFAVMWILCLTKQVKDKYYITYMWNLKNNTNKCIHKTEKDSQIQNNLWLPKAGEKKKGKLGMGLRDTKY